MPDDEKEEVVSGELVPDEEAPQEAKLATAQVLLDKLREDDHPSITQMDIIERMLPPELFPQYLEILTEKVRNARYPSTDMLERLQRLSGS